MKSSTLARWFSALLLVVFLFGSAASGYAKFKDSHSFVKTEISKAKNFNDLSVFAYDAIFVDVPINHIGFYQFSYSLKTGSVEVIHPVAHAPPN